MAPPPNPITSRPVDEARNRGEIYQISITQPATDSNNRQMLKYKTPSPQHNPDIPPVNRF